MVLIGGEEGEVTVVEKEGVRGLGGLLVSQKYRGTDSL